MRTIVLGLTLMSCAGIAHATKFPFAIYGPGNESCGAYVSEPDGSMTKGLDMEWVMGFVTGIGEWRANTNGAPLKTDSTAMEVWLDNYCRAHPLDEFHTAVEALVVTLAKRANQAQQK